MITSRRLEEQDRKMLDESLAKDEYHKTTTSEFFYEAGTVANVYNLGDSPVLVLRACKSLRIDIQFLDNGDVRRNAAVLMGGFKTLVDMARANGFKELCFCSESPQLIEFCKKHFGYEEVKGELRLKI